MKILFSFTALAAICLPLGAQSNPLSNGQKGFYTVVKTNIVKAAQKMPEENYAYKPTPEVRSFGQIIGHIADAQYMFCAIASGAKNPSPGVEKSMTTKAALVEALEESAAYCDKVYDGMTDAHAGDMVKMFGRDQPKLLVLTVNIAHDDEHYGNLVTYMRLKGLVPPSSEAAPPAAKK
jgi:uncharacterized damage-inducible protein DinB